MASGPALHLPLQPGLCQHPVAFDGARRDPNRRRGLIDGHAAEEAAFDDTTLARAEPLQSIQCFVDRDEKTRVVVSDLQQAGGTRPDLGE